MGGTKDTWKNSMKRSALKFYKLKNPDDPESEVLNLLFIHLLLQTFYLTYYITYYKN